MDLAHRIFLISRIKLVPRSASLELMLIHTSSLLGTLSGVRGRLYSSAALFDSISLASAVAVESVVRTSPISFSIMLS